jgi:hypothetical protein
MLKSQPPWDWHELSLSSPHSTYARSLSHCNLYQNITIRTASFSSAFSNFT